MAAATMSPRVCALAPPTAAKFSLLDHLVGASDNRRRKFKAERLGRPEINDQLKLRRLLDRQISGPRPLEDLVDEPGGAIIESRIVHAVAQEPAHLDELAGRVRGW